MLDLTILALTWLLYVVRFSNNVSIFLEVWTPYLISVFNVEAVKYKILKVFMSTTNYSHDRVNIALLTFSFI